jgi:hypothetical protein
MTIPIAQPDFQRLVHITQNQPWFSAQNERQNFITLAFGMAGKADVIRAQLNMSGSPMSAAVELILFLSRFGQVMPGVEALGVFIDQLLLNMGMNDDADFMAEVIQRYRLVSPPPAIAEVVPVPVPVPVSLAGDKYIFISYARPEQSIAQQVEKYLSAAGFRIFQDVKSIGTGDQWDITIESALHETTHMVLLLSTASMPYRKEVYREWFYYDQQRKPILPLYVQDCTLHSRMIAYNYIDARHDLAGALEKLARSLHE